MHAALPFRSLSRRLSIARRIAATELDASFCIAISTKNHLLPVPARIAMKRMPARSL